MEDIQKEIAVLLTVHNRKDKTLDCLSCVYSQQVPEKYTVDVYLTDDGCTDGTPEAIREQFPQVYIVQGDGNLYWNRGMYTAWETASKAKDYDYYLWLNDDTHLFEDAIEKLLTCSVEYLNKAIIVGATVDTATHNKVTYGGRIKGKIPKPKGDIKEVDYFNGNIVLVPQAVYQVLGNLDRYFTHSKGDFDYGLRAKNSGIKLYQVGETLGECDEHESLDTWCNPNVPFKKRWSLLHRPNGMPPKETFYLEKRHIGLLKASFHYITVYIRCFFPIIWKYKAFIMLDYKNTQLQ